MTPGKSGHLQRRKDVARIHTMAHKLGMDTADKSLTSDYRAMLLAHGGRTSTSDMDAAALARVIRHLVAATGGQPRSMSPRQYIELLWQQLGDAGKLEEPGPGGLSKFLHSQVGVHLPSALTGRQAARVIEALKAWKARSAAPAR